MPKPSGFFSINILTLESTRRPSRTCRERRGLPRRRRRHGVDAAGQPGGVRPLGDQAAADQRGERAADGHRVPRRPARGADLTAPFGGRHVRGRRAAPPAGCGLTARARAHSRADVLNADVSPGPAAPPIAEGQPGRCSPLDDGSSRN